MNIKRNSPNELLTAVRKNYIKDSTAVLHKSHGHRLLIAGNKIVFKFS